MDLRPGIFRALFHRQGSCLSAARSRSASLQVLRNERKRAWMMDDGKFPVSFLDIQLRGGRGDTEGIVVSGVGDHVDFDGVYHHTGRLGELQKPGRIIHKFDCVGVGWLGFWLVTTRRRHEGTEVQALDLDLYGNVQPAAVLACRRCLVLTDYNI